MSTETVFDVRWGSATDTGLLRADNQDAALSEPPVFLVADGMGGHAAGREAADLVVEAFAATCQPPWASPRELVDSITAADRAVRELGDRVPGAPGSTVTGAGIASHDGTPSWLVFNVGDSRTYLLRDEALELITVDHSQRQLLRDQGMAEAHVRALTAGNVITRAIGGGLRGVPQPDQWLVPAAAGDRVLICSDGLTDELSDPLIAALLLTNDDPGQAARALVDAAVRSGGRDNVTAVVVDAVAVSGPAALPALGTDDTTDDVEEPAIDDTRPDLPVLA